MAVTAAAALALPAAANAAVTGQVTGTNAVLTGDETSETITIGVDNGLLTHNTLPGLQSATDFDSDAGIQTLPADDGTLTIYPIGVDRISKNWIAQPSGSWFRPAKPLRPRFMDTPIVFSPMEVPTTQSGSMPASCSAWYTPTWYAPNAPPPCSTSTTLPSPVLST